MKIKRSLKALLVSGALFTISGCASQVSTFQKSVDHYDNSPDLVSLEYLKKEMYESYILTFSKLTKADQIIKIDSLTERAMVSLAKNREWGVLSDTIKRSFSSRKNHEVGQILIDHYQGSDPVLLEVMGWAALRQGNPYDAYRYFETSAFNDRLRAALPRGLAYHYGCKDLYDMWGTVINSKRYIDRDPMPMSEKKLKAWELSNAQESIEMKKPISIPQSCEILNKA